MQRGDEKKKWMSARRGGGVEVAVLSFPRMSTRVSKKARTAASQPWDWRITISTPQTFKTFLTIVYRVLSQCPFQLVKAGSFCGVRVDSMDSSMSCMIKASYECEIESNVELTNESFCVVTATFNTLLKDVQPSHILTLTRYSNSGDLTITASDRNDGTTHSTCTLTLLDEESNGNQLRMQDITFDYMVEMDLARLKSYCKKAADINSTHIEFKLDEPEGVEDAQHVLFSVCARSDTASFIHTHQSVTSASASASAGGGGVAGEGAGEDGVHYTRRAVPVMDGSLGMGGADGGGAVAAPLPVCEWVKERYNEVFSTTYLNLVLKSMDRQTVQLYMRPELPLVLRYGLGNDLSHILVILAPKVRDE
jgi:hypothetical protein